jgi:hypothetical protein
MFRRNDSQTSAAHQAGDFQLNFIDNRNFNLNLTPLYNTKPGGLDRRDQSRSKSLDLTNF